MEGHNEVVDAKWLTIEEIKELASDNQPRSPWALEAIEKLSLD